MSHLLHLEVPTFTMMDATEVAAAELLLQNADFPDHYVDMQHPDDYSTVDRPFVEYITNSYAHHYRLIVRVCRKLGEREYLPMSFVCDTGAPTALYLSDKAYRMLSRHKRVLEDDAGNVYAVICETECLLQNPICAVDLHHMHTCMRFVFSWRCIVWYSAITFI